MKPLFAACAILALAACSPAPKTQTGSVPARAAPKIVAPPGTYALDPSHTHIGFSVGHLGFSNYTAGFDKASGKLAFDPANPAAMTVEATIDPTSLDLNAPPAGFQAELMGETYFNAKAFPAITFRSTKVELTGERTARVTGDLSLHGITKPVVLETTFNGGWAPNPYDGARIGFSAHGTLRRSEFGMGAGVPPAGSKLGVSDEVRVTIETEFAMGAPAAG